MTDFGQRFEIFADKFYVAVSLLFGPSGKYLHC